MSKIYNQKIQTDSYCTHTLLLNQVSKNSKVLEFGCGAGGTTRYLKNDLGCDVTIVEYDNKAYVIAIQHATDGFCGDAETLEWFEKFKNEKFDFILFGDVLEHLRRPEIVLNKSKELLKDDGRIVISIPNNCHSSVLAEIHGNNFHYNEVGLLDNTHVHLFSYNSLCRMIKNCDLDIIVYDAFCLALEGTEFGNFNKILDENIIETIKSKPMSNVYQFVFTLAKPNSGLKVINKLKERMGYNAKIYITDILGFPLQCFDVNLINKQTINITLNTNKNIGQVKVLPMYNSGCMLKNIEVLGDNKSIEYTTNAYKVNDLNIFLDNDDTIFIENLSQTDVLQVKADIVFKDQ